MEKNFTPIKAVCFGVAALAHAALIAGVLLLEGPSATDHKSNSIVVELADILFDTPPKQDSDTDLPAGQPEQTQIGSTLNEREGLFPPPEPEDTSDARTAGSLTVENAPRFAEKNIDLEVGPARGEDVPSISQVADFLAKADCLNLRRRDDDTCANLERAQLNAPWEREMITVPRADRFIKYGPKSNLERFFSRQDEEPFIIPGMSADLFVDGVSPRDPNAERIRRGDAPIWDAETVEQLRTD